MARLARALAPFTRFLLPIQAEVPEPTGTTQRHSEAAAGATKALARGCCSFGVGTSSCAGIAPCEEGVCMKFFLPHAESAAHAEEIYASIRSFLWAQEGANCADWKIFRLLYREQGQLVSAKVGHRHPLSGEPVIAIVYEPGKDRYHVCTPTRGVITGRAIAVEGRS